MVVADEAERQLENLRLTARTDALQGVGHSYYVRLTGPESPDTQGERGRLRCASCPYGGGTTQSIHDHHMGSGTRTRRQHSKRSPGRSPLHLNPIIPATVRGTGHTRITRTHGRVVYMKSVGMYNQTYNPHEHQFGKEHQSIQSSQNFKIWQALASLGSLGKPWHEKCMYARSASS